MKIFSLIVLAVLLFVSGCGPIYLVARDKEGIYRTTTLAGNFLATPYAYMGEQVGLGIKKYTHAGTTFFTITVSYVYPQKGISLGMMANEGFGILPKSGVLISINNANPVPLKYKSPPKHEFSATRNSSGITNKTHIETVECVLTYKQLIYMMKAKSIRLTLVGASNNHKLSNKIESDFTEENFKMLKRFYDEEIKGKAAGAV